MSVFENLVLNSSQYFVVVVVVCTVFFLSNTLLPGSWTVAIGWKLKLFSISFRPSTTSIQCPGALITRSITILNDYDNIYNMYNGVSHL